MANPEAEFSITPKTTWQQVKEWTPTSSLAMNAVSQEIVANAKEVCPMNDTSWDEILGLVRAQEGARSRRLPGDRTNYGVRAIYDSFASTIASTMTKMEWNMDTPEMVYMSGTLFRWALGKEIRSATVYFKEFEDGTRRGPSDPTLKPRFDQLQTERRERVERLKAYKSTLDERFIQYAQASLDVQRFSNWTLEQYTGVLDQLFFISRTGANREKVYRILKEGGDIAEASSELAKPERK